MSNKSKLFQFFRVWKKLPFADKLATHYQEFVDEQRVRMAGSYDGLLQLSFLAIICGIVSGGVIVLFRWCIENGAGIFTGEPTGEGFESLSILARFSLVLIGSILVGIFLHFLAPRDRNLGVVHVIERLTYHQGYLPIRNAVVQFIGAVIALASGQSMGREGPGVHLGATAGSALGRSLEVPNNSTRTLVGCGVAAAISAGFNTPLAGIIFAMEVVMMEYTIIGFTPVIISAVSATTLCRAVFGDSPAFSVPPFEWTSMTELPYVAILGFAIGCLSAGFTHSTLYMSSLLTDRPIWLRCGLAGLIVGLIAIVAPEVMGIGYDTVNLVLLGQISFSTLALILVAKTVATACAAGLGIPGGLIGANLFMGACAGSLIALAAQTVKPDLAYSGFYAMLGMGAMMGATLQAPLAALMALLELTANQSIILPGMICIIFATLSERLIFKKPSIYRLLMIAKGLDFRNSPVAQALRRIGVASVMDRNLVQQPEEIDFEKAESILKLQPRWLMVLTENQQASLISATDLSAHLAELRADSEENGEHLPETVNLLTFPAKRNIASRITTIDTMQEAYERMESEGVDHLFVSGAYGKTQEKIYGVITEEHIEKSYNKHSSS